MRVEFIQMELVFTYLHVTGVIRDCREVWSWVEPLESAGASTRWLEQEKDLEAREFLLFLAAPFRDLEMLCRTIWHREPPDTLRAIVWLETGFKNLTSALQSTLNQITLQRLPIYSEPLHAIQDFSDMDLQFRLVTIYGANTGIVAGSFIDRVLFIAAVITAKSRLLWTKPQPNDCNQAGRLRTIRARTLTTSQGYGPLRSCPDRGLGKPKWVADSEKPSLKAQPIIGALNSWLSLSQLRHSLGAPNLNEDTDLAQTQSDLIYLEQGVISFIVWEGN
ncbi:hypothetical protein K438DRAFT_1767371 [Mycena galopus ATCC 62051]|nr:hypothetical protein K438DRAFT_1767371 [Mycena galopus ATCC 62051]